MPAPQSTTRGPRPLLSTGRQARAHLDRDRDREKTFSSRYGALGRRFNRRSPFFIGLTGALGVALAYLMVRALAAVTQVLTIIGLSLFLGIGLQPVVEWLGRHRVRRPLAVTFIIVGFVAVVGGFLAAAIPPITHEAHELMVNFPRYRRNVAAGRGWLGHIVAKLHLSSYIRPNSAAAKKLKLAAVGGVIGAGKLLLSASASVVAIIALTIYFLIALPSVAELWLSFVPASRRERASLLAEEIFGRVGGFVLGNVITSLVAGVGTTVWLMIFDVPYAFLLGLFVAILDLVPVVGSTIAGVVVSLVALSKGLSIAIATGAFYVGYRLFEDYLLVPRVMNRTVRISPGLTIIATLLGAELWGLIGALVAIPIAAAMRLVLEEVVFPATDRL